MLLPGFEFEDATTDYLICAEFTANFGEGLLIQAMGAGAGRDLIGTLSMLLRNITANLILHHIGPFATQLVIQGY